MPLQPNPACSWPTSHRQGSTSARPRRSASAVCGVREQKGTAVILVEHDLDMVAQVVDRVIVLDFGNEIASGHARRSRCSDPTVRQAYLGKTAVTGKS